MSKKTKILSALLLLIVLVFAYLIFRKNSNPSTAVAPVVNLAGENIQATNQGNPPTEAATQTGNSQPVPNTQTQPVATSQTEPRTNLTGAISTDNKPAATVNTNNKSVSLAQCLKNQGVKFYGAFWCSHCQNQKALFGADAVNLPFIECATPDGQGQLEICKENNIGGYPTWVFPDGSSLAGELTLEQLSAKSGCSLTK